jgi:hypothetical protein
MADNLVVKDGLGTNKTLRTEDIGSDVHVPLQIPADETGAPFTAANPVPVAPPATSAYGTGTRAYAAIQRQSVVTASARFTIGTLGASREILLHASTRCFVLTGDGTVAAAAGTSIPLATDEKFHLRVPTGHTHIAVIRDTADGFISIAAVA